MIPCCQYGDEPRVSLLTVDRHDPPFVRPSQQTGTVNPLPTPIKAVAKIAVGTLTSYAEALVESPE